MKFMGIFAVTQVPLAVSEGLLTVVVFNLLAKYSRNELETLGALPREVKADAPGT
jgi:cobalt/nickel transport system permease protein